MQNLFENALKKQLEKLSGSSNKKIETKLGRAVTAALLEVFLKKAAMILNLLPKI